MKNSRKQSSAVHLNFCFFVIQSPTVYQGLVIQIVHAFLALVHVLGNINSL